jgi:hypothetical protein
MQGTVSVIVAMSKADIHWAVTSFLKCQCNAEPKDTAADGVLGKVRVTGIYSSSDPKSRSSTAEVPSEQYKYADGARSEGSQALPISMEEINSDDSQLSEATREQLSEALELGNDEEEGGVSESFKEVSTRQPQQEQAVVLNPVESSLRAPIDMTGDVVDSTPELVEGE